MFNTEYNGATNDIGVLDAVAQVSTSPKFNIWVGRFLPPSDRANLYGPYYANHWGVYTDGIQDGYPFVFQGRDNGVMYWGQFGKVKVSGGAFDGASATGDDDGPRRRPRPGRLLGHGGRLLPERHLLRRQEPARHRRRRARCRAATAACNVDFLLEKKVGDGGAFTIESRVRRTTTVSAATTPTTATSDGAYVLGAYLFPKIGDRPGQFADPRQVRAGARSRRASPTRLRPEHHRVQLQLRHQAVQRARDVLLPATPTSTAVQTGLQGSRRRPPDPDVSASSARSRMSPRRSLHET